MTFTHADAGTPETVWEQALAERRVPTLPLDGVERLVVVAAHPDDETLGAGGLLAVASRRGIAAVVVLATRGEASHPDSPTHPPHVLAGLREAESRAAATILHPGATVVSAALPDGRLAERADALVTMLDGLALGPGDLVAAPWEGDRHPDHAAAGAAARSAASRVGAAVMEYPLWLWHWGAPDDVPWASVVALDLDERAVQAKREGMLAHTTQVRPLSGQPGDEVLLHEGFLAHFHRPLEVFLRVDETGEEPVRPSDAAAHFDAMLARDPDPWGFDSRWYEKRKRAMTLAALPDERYRRALEVGCSTGVLTRELADRADAVLGVDVSPRAVARAREQTADLPHVEVEVMQVPEAWPEGTFDLVVVSEMAYYLSDEGVGGLLDRIVRCLSDDGVLVACHWRHPAAGRDRPGDEVHALLRASPALERVMAHDEPDFLLDVLARPDRGSVAQRTGIIA